MEWLKQLIEKALKSKVKDDVKVDELVSGIVENSKKEIGKSFVAKDDFNSKNDELKQTKTKMDDLQKKVDELSKSGGDAAKIKEDLDKVNQEFADYKKNTEKRESNRKKITAIEKGLRDAKASEDAVDLLTGQFEIDKITLDNKGNIVNWDDHLKGVKESRKSLFGEVKPQGDKPPNPGGSGGNDEFDKLSDEEYYNKIGFPGKESKK